MERGVERGTRKMEDYLMSDEVKQTVPVQGEGTPGAQVSAQVQSQDAVTPGQEPASQPGTEEAKPVTAQDLQALKEELSKQIQSQVDKSSTRVQKRLAEIDQAVAVLRKGGREITDADVKTLKQNAAAEAMIEPEQESIAEQTADPLDAAQWDQNDPVTRRIIELQLQYGMEIKGNMPQAAKIERGKGAVAFVKSYEAALKEAVGGQSSASTTTETKPTTPPAARIPASGGSGGTPAKSGRELLGRAHKED